jgi:hypothetical protein
MSDWVLPDVLPASSCFPYLHGKSETVQAEALPYNYPVNELVKARSNRVKLLVSLTSEKKTAVKIRAEG